jgi:dynein heavy chain
VNFDPDLVGLLREVKYILLLQKDCPDSALAIFEKAEVYRRQTGNLDLIVDLYNSSQVTLLPVERPLLQPQLEKIDATLQRGLKNLSWKSHGVEGFITESMKGVRELSSTLNMMKASLRRIVDLMESWAHVPMIARQGKPCVVSEFEEGNRTVWAAQYALVKDGGNEIHKLLKEMNKKLKVSQGLPDWKAYVDFVNNIVVAGLSKVLQGSLAYLGDQLDPAKILKEDKIPLVEISLDLYGRHAYFHPDVAGQSGADASVRNAVYLWIERIFHVAELFRRVDTNEGHYVREMQMDPHVQVLMANIEDHLVHCEGKALEYQRKFERFAYIWSSDLSSEFALFLETRAYVAIMDQPDAQDEEEKEVVQQQLNLDSFDQEIEKYLLVQGDLSEFRATADICFFRVNAQPIKQAIATWITKWIYLYSQFLHDHVVGKLTSLFTFIAKVTKGLAVEVSTSEEKDKLIDVMTHIRDVKKIMNSTQAMFGPLRNAILLLKKHGIGMTSALPHGVPVVEYLENVPLYWDNLVNETFKKKELIQPLQTQIGEGLKKSIINFITELDTFHSDFKKRAPFAAANVKIDDAYKTLGKFHEEIFRHEHAAVQFAELEDLFELSPANHKKLAEARQVRACACVRVCVCVVSFRVSFVFYSLSPIPPLFPYPPYP